jgi:lysine 6-dehydrogenase
MVDRYDDREKVTSMGKTTGYTASIVAQMVGSGKIKGKGTLAPERAVEGPLVETLLSELGRRGVSITSRRRRLI